MENKNSKMAIIIICLVAIILIVITGLVAFNYGKEKGTSKKDVIIEEKKEEEKDITNKANKELFDKKITIVESALLKGVDELSKANSIYTKDVVGTENLDTDSLYTSVFKNNESKFFEVDEKLQNKYDEWADYKELLEEVKKIYGDIDKFSGKTEGCQNFTLNKNTLYYTHRCGTGFISSPLRFIDRITELDKSTYVYVYVGAYELSADDPNMITIYSDPYLEKKYKSQSYEASLDFSEKDYKNFTQFRFTFIKNVDGYYIFSKLEKITK